MERPAPSHSAKERGGGEGDGGDGVREVRFVMHRERKVLEHLPAGYEVYSPK